ncbi:putative NAD dependent epimerase/dehydratase [Xylariales sp. AK1849]|nr:putative NAD dependent epimerase/dehydratase [Xylariales sp. AK1849]
MSSYIASKLASGSKLHIFVTGATGYIGGAFTSLAISQGHTIHGLSRNEAGDEKLRALGAVPVRGDLTTYDVLSREAAAADAVVHLAWVHDFGGDFNAIADGDVAAVNAMCAPLKDTGKPIITASGCGGYDTEVGVEATEDTPKKKGLPIVDARTRAELNGLNKNGVHAVVMRLSPYVYGRGGKGFLLNWMATAGKLGESLYVNEGNYQTATLHIDDAAALFLAAVQYAGKAQIYNALGSNATTLKQMAEAVGEVMEVPVRSVTHKEAAEKWGQFLAFFNYFDTRASNKKAREQLHWEPKGPAFLDDIVKGSYRDVAFALKAQDKDKIITMGDAIGDKGEK